MKVGNGLDESVQMGPVITAASRERIAGFVAQGERDGAKAILGGDTNVGNGKRSGSFVAPTVLDNLPASSSLMETEIFGPVLSLVHADSVEEAVAMIDRSAYGQCLFDFYVEWVGSAQVSQHRADRQRRREYWRAGADGLLPVQRLEGQLLWG